MSRPKAFRRTGQGHDTPGRAGHFSQPPADVRALTLELRKPGGVRERTDSADAARTKLGEKPGGAVSRQVTVLADVIDVDRRNKTVALKGPKGNIVELD